ncbi:hypothetical protein BJ912DRAFT_1096512 [Pholiota molesta]|nr:hypothetical protein BJ912DRAFT_1096512 [Pholiota molesta]
MVLRANFIRERQRTIAHLSHSNDEPLAPHKIHVLLIHQHPLHQQPFHRYPPTKSAPHHSPINNVPYDVLQEIFLHSRPKNPLDEVQPNPKTAPILLCHVSSSWRSVALSTPSLWIHLHIRLPILWDRERNPTALSSEAVIHTVEFMKWWRNNHRVMDPLLRFNVFRSEDMENFEIHEDNSDDEVSSTVYPSVDPEALDFLLDYMSSARYLEVGEFYDYLMQKRGALVATSSKLHTLVALGDQLDGMYHGYYPEYPYHATVPLPEIPTTLQRLLIQQTQVLRNCRLSNWSTLTHLSLDPVYIVQLSTWFTVIRELVHLQWGDFSIMIGRTGAVGVQPDPPVISLSSLLALSISCYSIRGIELPITTLFQN